MTIMNTNRDIYHWKDGKKPILIIIFQKVKNPPIEAKFLKNPNFTRNTFLMQNLGSGRKFRRI